MKKFLLTICVVVGAVLIAPEVQAGGYDCGPSGRRMVLYYDYCGRPVYGYIRDDYRHGYGRRYPQRHYGYYNYPSYPRYSYRPAAHFSLHISR